jgi:DNA-binding HxlR family transcriptional regulator
MVQSGNTAQQKIKELNRSGVMVCLKDEAKRFKDLKEMTGLSPMGLTKILAGLEEEGLIGRKTEGRWSSYILTRKGEKMLFKMTTLDMIIGKIQDDGGKYHHDYSGAKGSMELSGLVWGIQDDLVIGKEIGEKDNPMLPGIVRSTQAHIFREIKSAAKNNLIKLDEKKKGQMVLGFVIDYDDLVKSINDDSLLQYGKNAGKRTKKGKWDKANDELKEFGPAV